MMTLQEIGETIQLRRKLLGLQQADLSEISEINQRTIHLIENGEGNPSFNTLNKILNVIGMEVTIIVKSSEGATGDSLL